MKTLILKTALIGIIATVALSSEAFSGTKEAAAKAKEAKQMKEVIEADLLDFQELSPVNTDASIYFYDAEGKLLHESKLSDLDNPETKRLINTSNFLAEVNGSQYFIQSAQ